MVDTGSSLTFPAPAPSPVARTLAFLGPDFSLFLLFLSIFVALGVTYGAHFHVAGEGSIAIAVGLGGGLIAVRFLWRARAIVLDEGQARAEFFAAARRILRDWGPMILLVVLFENLHAYTGLIRATPIDDSLYKIDVAVFGVEPSVWVGQHFATPLLTDWFALAYGMYFILPMVLATSVVLHLCIGFLFFILFPAGPPRFYDPLMHGGFHPQHLTSYFGLWEWSQGAWDSANPVRDHSSFPSMHCAIAMMTLLYGWRFGHRVFPRRPRLVFWLCLPIVVSLWLSTVYLRHHWVPDCIAGMALGVACFFITPILRKRWPGAEAAAHT